MARAGINKEVNSFIKGLITESNVLSFAENASVVDENCILNIDGSRQRRLGLGFEAGGSGFEVPFDDTSIAQVAISVHEWLNVANDTEVGLLVVQVGQYLLFFDAFSEITSETLKNSENILELDDIDPSFSIETTNMDGFLVVVTGSKHINILSYDADTDVVTQSARNIKIRDRFGIDDTLEVDSRPSSLSDAHKYNLLNQGWSTSKITTFFSSQGVYPSNADVYFLGKDDTNTFSPEELVKLDFQNTPASKGHFVIDPFDRGSSRSTAFSTGYGGGSTGSGSSSSSLGGDFSRVDLP